MIPIKPQSKTILFDSVAKKTKVSKKKIKVVIDAFDKSIREILLNADEVALKGLFSFKMKPYVKKRVMERGKTFVVGRKQFTKSRMRKAAKKFRKKKKK